MYNYKIYVRVIEFTKLFFNLSLFISCIPPVSERFCFKTDRKKVPISITDHSCRPSCSEFSVIFLQNSHKYGLGSFRKLLIEGTSHQAQVPPAGN